MSCNGCRQTDGPKPIRREKTKGFFGEVSSNEMTHEEVRSKSPIESPRTPCQCENKDGNEFLKYDILGCDVSDWQGVFFGNLLS